jgi:hypothetical protein
MLIHFISTPVDEAHLMPPAKDPPQVLLFIFCLMFLFNRRLSLNTCTYNMVTISLVFVMIKMLILHSKMPIFLTDFLIFLLIPIDLLHNCCQTSTSVSIIWG